MELIRNSILAVKLFFSKKNKFVVLLCSLLVFLVVMSLIIATVKFCTKPRPIKILPEKDVDVSTKEMVLPETDRLSEEYLFSRESREWTEEQTDRWFTQPDSSSIKSLENANNSINDEILGAAP